MLLRRGAIAIWDFLVDDDRRLALAAATAIALVALGAALGLGGWWLAPLVALATLHRSLRRR